MLIRSKMFAFNGQNTSPCFDSSPFFAERPTSFLCVGYPYNYNNASFDADLDSLHYGWDYALDGNGWLNAVPLTFIPPYSVNNALPGNPTLNVNNGQFTVFPQTGISPQGNFVTVMRVESYRCNIKIAEVYREIQVSLSTLCPQLATGTNTPPKLFPKPFPDPITGAPASSFEKTIYAGDTVIATFSFNDFDVNLDGSFQTATMDPLSSEFATNYATSPPSNCDRPPCAYFTNVSSPFPVIIPPVVTPAFPPQAQVRFFWPTTCNHRGGASFGQCATLSNTYYFILRLKDNACPIPAYNTQTLSITVIEPPKF